MSEESRFGPYTVFECVGSGGMATVHRATIQLDGTLERDVALKRLLPHLADDDRFVEDFVREAKLAAQLTHANIVRVFELGKIGSTYFIAMELVRGAALGSMMRKATTPGKRPSIGAVFSLMLELTDALDHAYNCTGQHGEPLRLVHRDLTPSNLLITEDGHLKIIDFGVAKAMSGDLSTNSGYAKGKVGYMSPEALAGQAVDARADIFGVGVVLWELITGRRLFQPSHEWDTNVHEKQVELPSTFNPECPPELDRLVLQAVALRREDRWPSAGILHEALARVARPFASTANPTAVVRWKRTLRVESNFEPYANFIVEQEPAPTAAGSGTRTPAKLQRSISPHVVPRNWPPEPTTQPERLNQWPPEPTTTPHISQPETSPETPSRSFADLPLSFVPNDFDGDAGETTSEARRPPAPAPSERRKPSVPPPIPERPRKASVPPPIPPAKRRAAPLRTPGPSPSVDRIPSRSPLDTEPNRVVGQGPVDTEPNPIVDANRDKPKRRR